MHLSCLLASHARFDTNKREGKEGNAIIQFKRKRPEDEIENHETEKMGRRGPLRTTSHGTTSGMRSRNSRIEVMQEMLQLMPLR